MKNSDPPHPALWVSQWAAIAGQRESPATVTNQKTHRRDAEDAKDSQRRELESRISRAMIAHAD